MNSPRIDLQLNNNGIVIQNNDIIIGQSDSQHIIDTLNAFPGWWKEYYTDGVGLFQYLKSSAKKATLQKSIKLNLTVDGYIVSSPTVSYDQNGLATVNPNASR